MAFDFNNTKQKDEQQFREEIRILATQIETINQQLAGGAGGSGGGPALNKAFSDMNAKLSFLYEFLKTMQTDMRSQTKESFEQVQTTVNTTLQKNLGDIYAAQQDTNKAVQNIKTVGGGGGSQDLSDIKSTLKDLVSVYKEEVGIFKAQNEFLQKKLLDIEQRLGELEK
jgi:hypothetical protein